MPVRNEGWVLGYSARVALQWVDALVILNHASTDDTSDIINRLACEYGNRVIPMYNADVSWHEMQHRQQMLECARIEGATHIAIIDADELLSGNLLSRIRQGIESTPNGSIVRLPIYNMRGVVTQYHMDGMWAHQTTAFAFVNQPSAAWMGDQFHHREPYGILGTPNTLVSWGEGGVMHLWGVSERRLVARHALYKITERLRWPQKSVAEINSYYNMAIYPPGATATQIEPVYASAADRIKHRLDQPTYLTQSNSWHFATTPEDWLEPYARFAEYLKADATPWQEQEARRLVELYGTGPFSQLDLFGVV